MSQPGYAPLISQPASMFQPSFSGEQWQSSSDSLWLLFFWFSSNHSFLFCWSSWPSPWWFHRLCCGPRRHCVFFHLVVCLSCASWRRHLQILGPSVVCWLYSFSAHAASTLEHGALCRTGELLSLPVCSSPLNFPSSTLWLTVSWVLAIPQWTKTYRSCFHSKQMKSQKHWVLS